MYLIFIIQNHHPAIPSGVVLDCVCVEALRVEIDSREICTSVE